MAAPRLGRVQLKIMNVLWGKGRATAREITDALNEDAPIAHSTVQTLLRKLEAKDAVGHERDGRTFIFKPLVEPENVRKKATREFVDRVFGGSTAGLVSYLLKSEQIPDDELGRIRELIDPPQGEED
ncbi:MAG: BlaI/MecI/CopY family transcriptional regulator [bacterium]|nr:BlaI/MecI/CopY family transcriptional regulator [bacterium]